MLAWRLSNTMDVSTSMRRRKSLPASGGRTFNTDQGSQLTSAGFTGALMAADVRISMDSRARWMDNVFIERLWRSLKHEDIYLKGYTDGREAHAGIAAWIAFYNRDQNTHLAMSSKGRCFVGGHAIPQGTSISVVPVL